MILAAILTFTAVFLTVLALYFAVTTARKSPEAQLKRRLKGLVESGKAPPPEELTGELLRKTTPIEQLVFDLPLIKKIKRLVEHSGVHIRPLRFICLTAMVSGASFVVLFALRVNALIALLAAVITGLIPFIYLSYQKKQRESKFDEQLPDALTMIARSLRAGHSLPGAIELISQEMPEPTSGLFKIVFDQQQLGMRLSDSLKSLLEKIESLDLHFFVTIVKINSETGGNFAEILEKLADTIRSRAQIRRQVQVYTAEGRFSGYVLALLPVVLFFAFNIMNPTYMKVFFHERSCQMALGGAVIAQIIGFYIIMKIVKIRI